MRDRTLIVSAFLACCFHALLLFLNFGVAPPRLASAAASLEVELVGPAESTPASAPCASPQTPADAEPEQPAVSEPLEPPEDAEPEPVIEPEVQPEPEPEEIPQPEHLTIREPEPHMEPVPERKPERREHDVLERVVVEPERELARRATSSEDAGQETAYKGPDSSDGVPDNAGPSSESTGSEQTPSSRALLGEETVDREPAYSYNPKPAYPRSARRRGQEGTVLLRVEVLANGRVGEVVVDTSSGYESLDEAAVKAVRKWRFTPARRGSARVNCWVRVPVEFDLRDRK